MKIFSLIFVVLIALNLAANGQIDNAKPKMHLTENTVVKDSSGMVYPYAVWKKMLSGGNYLMKEVNYGNDSTEYLIVKLDPSQKDKWMSRMPKPKESIFFTDGEKISSFTARDINGNKFKLKDLVGKVVVLNFWFIGCPPCRQEIPELNEIALKYANDASVIFIAIALDNKDDIEQFIKTNPFEYHIIEEGKLYADIYRLNLYPTNVVLDKEGKVRFHASGYTANTPYWIRKTIDELK